MKRELDSAMEKCEQLGELIRIIRDGGESTPHLLYDLAAEKCNEISLLLTNRPVECFRSTPETAGEAPSSPDEAKPATTKDEETENMSASDTGYRHETETLPERPEESDAPVSRESDNAVNCTDTDNNYTDTDNDNGTDTFTGAEIVSAPDSCPCSFEEEVAADGHNDGGERLLGNDTRESTMEELTHETGYNQIPDNAIKYDTQECCCEADFNNTDIPASDSVTCECPGEPAVAEVKETVEEPHRDLEPDEGRCRGNNKLKRIRELLSINDLYLFKRELFNNDTKVMNSLFEKLEMAGSLDECERILNDFVCFTPEDGSPAADFFERLKNRFQQKHS